MHSGIHGGLTRNPATELCRLLATLHDANGKIAVEGYYDDLLSPTETESALAAASDMSDDQYEAEIGLPPVGGERGLPMWQRRGFRPTIEINGLTSGYQGEGPKTIIPAWASAKLSSRISAGQDPEKCLELLKKHLSDHAPQGLHLEFFDAKVGGAALLLRADSSLARRTAEVVLDMTQRPAAYRWEGASIPIIPLLASTSGAEPLLVGFGLEEDNIHAPNESFSVEQFEMCFTFCSMFIQSLRGIDLKRSA